MTDLTATQVMEARAARLATRPLGHKAYGSTGHLPGSRMGPADHKMPDGQADICTVKTRDKHDRVYASEKLDGSCVAVANIDGNIVALGRAGYLAESSPFEQHHLFADWVASNLVHFEYLKPGERMVGEWLAQAHGTLYRLPAWHTPFVPFALFEGRKRLPWDQLMDAAFSLTVPNHTKSPSGFSTLHPVDIGTAMLTLQEVNFHRATEAIEGCVYLVERHGEFDFIGKYVAPDKVDGKYLPEVTGKAPLWNWHPDPDKVWWRNAEDMTRLTTGYSPSFGEMSRRGGTL